MKKLLLWLPLIGVVAAFVVVAVGGLAGGTMRPPRPTPDAARQREAPARIAVYCGGLDEQMAATICELSGEPEVKVLRPGARVFRFRRTDGRWTKEEAK